MDNMIRLNRSPVSQRKIEVARNNEQNLFLASALYWENGRKISPTRIMDSVVIPYWKMILNTICLTDI